MDWQSFFVGAAIGMIVVVIPLVVATSWLVYVALKAREVKARDERFRSELAMRQREHEQRVAEARPGVRRQIDTETRKETGDRPRTAGQVLNLK